MVHTTYDTMYHMAHTRKRIRKLSTAVFRGSLAEYSFDVYPITTAITDNPAVFIFSRRKVDKFGRGHHAVSCVGETQSIVSEIKRHKRARCIKGNEANVVCILREADSRIRTATLDDITAARVFSCVRGKFKPTIKSETNAKTAKILPFKPAARVKAVSSDNSTRPASTKRRNGATAKARKSIELVAAPKPARSKKPLKGKVATSGTRVSRGVGSDGGQHRLSKSKRSVAGRAKARVAQNSRSRAKLAA